ncbi:hypothetical protein [Dyadobacter sp. Leaf189]|uniref:hypothetical protein n=1 Tax=Dyadobacter sp. Leaf189 TaxID=1736295 RepID=UPI0006FD12FF|nr:hypothetical protein [Dyadobacter sp. Leaf189]KQS33589.1 hypothetical protein ASG33_05865 [Dyadobacter sp. Leaf189]
MNKRNMKRRRLAFLFPVFALLAALLLGAAVKFLWNATLPLLLDVNEINYWQAVALLVLCRILFGNFGRPGGGGPPRWGRWNRENGPSRFGEWRNKWKEMTPEERIRFRQEMRNRCRKPPENM